MDLDAAYLFRGATSGAIGTDGAQVQHIHNSNFIPAHGSFQAQRDHDYDSKTSAPKSDTCKSDRDSDEISAAATAERYVAVYSTTARHSLRLSTASLSTTGEPELVSFSEPVVSEDKWSAPRGRDEDYDVPKDSSGGKGSEVHLCISGPSSTTYTPKATPPSSGTHPENDAEDDLEVAELQQKLDVSYEWAYELEGELAELTLEVEDMRDMCGRLECTLSCKEEELTEIQLTNLQLRKRLSTAEALLAQRFCLNSPLCAGVGQSAASHTHEEQAVAATGPPFPAMPRSCSLPGFQYAQQSPPSSMASGSWTQKPPHAAVPAGPYPIPIPLRTTAAALGMRAALSQPHPSQGHQVRGNTPGSMDQMLVLSSPTALAPIHTQATWEDAAPSGLGRISGEIHARTSPVERLAPSGLRRLSAELHARISPVERLPSCSWLPCPPQGI